MLIIGCPTCGEKLNVPEEYIGKSGICNKCRNKFLVENPENNNITTIKQMEFLKELGVGEIPKNKKEAYELINKNSRQREKIQNESPSEKQINFLKELGVNSAEVPKTKKEASCLIDELLKTKKEKQEIYKSEYIEREKIYDFIEIIFPLFKDSDLDIDLPFEIEEIIYKTLLSSSLVSDIKENKNISISKIREILEPILGKTVFNFINRRTENSISDFEIDWNGSYSYLTDFLEYYEITVDSEGSFLFNLWMNNLGKRMSNSKGFKHDSSLSDDIIKYIQKVLNNGKEAAGVESI